jgi:membrane protease YdiL (CAAX protease family)
MLTRILDLFKRHPLIAFTVLAYSFSWSFWLFASGGKHPSTFLTWIGGFGPAIAAFILTTLLEGRDGLRRMLSKAFVWKIHLLWYLVALGLPIIGMVGLIAIYALISGDFAPLQSLGTWLLELGENSGVLVITLLLGLIVLIGEEFGWRGYALPKLRANHTDLVSSIGVGIIWGLWHLPNLWPFQPKQDALDLLFFMADIVTISILYTWLYIHSAESILLVSVFHSTYDVMVFYGSATLPFLRSTQGYELIVLLIMASLIVIRYGPKHFQSRLKKAG